MAEPSYEELRAENERLRRRISELEAQIERLTRALEASQRSGKRQAAPFSKGAPQPQPKKPGRKPGDDYGAKAHRPPPRQIDETCEAPLPQACPHCHSAVNETGVQDQYQVEIPRRPIQRRFRVHLGECSGCGAALQGRHPLQTSDALGAAGSGLGADAQASVCWLNKSAGLSHGKIVKLLKTLFGIELSRGGSAQVVARGARRCEPAYEAIQEAIRGSPTNAADETGWRIGGQSAWQHLLVNQRATCSLIDLPGRTGMGVFPSGHLGEFRSVASVARRAHGPGRRRGGRILWSDAGDDHKMCGLGARQGEQASQASRGVGRLRDGWKWLRVDG